MRRTALLTLAIALLGAGTAVGGPAQRPDVITQANDAGHAFDWTGQVAGQTVTPGPNLPSVANVNEQWFIMRFGAAKRARASVWLHWDTPEDLRLEVHGDGGRDATGSLRVLSDALPGKDEVVSFPVVNNRRYKVRVVGKTAAVTDFKASIWVRDVAGRNFVGPGRLVFNKLPIIAPNVEVPIDLVFVGFDAVEAQTWSRAHIDPHRLTEFRPVVGSELSEGGSGLIRREADASVRQFVTLPGAPVDVASAALPIQYKFKYCPIVASEPYSRSLFAAAKAATRSGEFANAFDREYLERYNARAGALRAPDHVVPPGSPVDFVDAVALESWIAQHPIPRPASCFKRTAGAYTLYVIDSYRPSYAAQYFSPSRYHTFRVMNSLTVDPDSGVQNGFDWGRTWGGRYRFLMLDVGAGPNGHEGATYTTGPQRGLNSGDSAALDPPIWEYRACSVVSCPASADTANLETDPVWVFYDRLGQALQTAIWMKFTHAPSFRPRAADRFIVSANTWHDATAYAPWPSRLDKLYSASTVQARVRELVPYARVDSYSRMKYLATEGAEQAALNEAKLQGAGRLPMPLLSTQDPVARFIASQQSRYLTTAHGAMTVPVTNVVFPAGYSWEPPATNDGVTMALGTDPWGSFASVNDSTKTPRATAPVNDSAGKSHAPVPDPRAGTGSAAMPTNTGRFGFTHAAIRGVGHTLGLYDAYIGIGWDKNVNADPSFGTGYFRTVDWMWATTATPMTDAFTYTRFETLDKDNLWTAHALDWIDRSLDDMADIFAALDSKGYRTIPKTITQQIYGVAGYWARSVGYIRAGLFLDAVKAARESKRLSERVVIAAAAAPRA